MEASGAINFGTVRHDVSILMIGAAGERYASLPPRSNSLVMIMRPPQSGHGHGCMRSSFSVPSVFSGSAELVASAGSGGVTPSNARTLARFSARLPLANKP
jgi:hypothetical protein